MLARILIYATMLGVLWHALIGCCAHHDHCLAGTTVSKEAASESHRCECHGHGGQAEVFRLDADSVTGRDAHHPAPACTGETCVMVSGEGRTAVLHVPVVEWFVPAPVASIPRVDGEGNIESVDNSGSFLTGRLRSHLVLRILLV